MITVCRGAAVQARAQMQQAYGTFTDLMYLTIATELSSSTRILLLLAASAAAVHASHARLWTLLLFFLLYRLDMTGVVPQANDRFIQVVVIAENAE